MSEQDEPYCTLSSALPRPTRAVQDAAWTLAEAVEKEMGTRSGVTAFYWQLIHLVQTSVGER